MEDYEKEEYEKKLKRAVVYNRIKELFNSKFIEHIWFIEDGYPEPVRLRYIEYDDGEYKRTEDKIDKCIYFVGELPAKTPKRFSTFDFEKNKLFFDEVTALKFREDEVKYELQNIQEYIKKGGCYVDCFKEKKLK